ncbi:Na+/H+ antiporter NhaC [Catenisphaera adipataccumulans]|jgi:NhaC family Na+:H+ antiporter|uniref:NhaC family Na+:H+ antiporter n=1 Tax=Catenisphaera adipataccumulans TaxID=700500 RepID=A0A7W8CZP0_9FIRM|nr:Na+/H+ antiporter NhaC [Catenisphaera adipataccumulans]MBB5183408.1 NhaC family Na+:H+ antiporter [Catenisphaera adipataccumulans]
MENTKSRKQPSTVFAVVSFIAIVAVLIIMINLGVNTTLSVFAGVIMAVIVTALLGIPWKETEKNIISVAADCMPTFLIVIMVGMLVGIWMASGTVPSLMYYGMQIISPKILVPLAFVLCGLTSEFTGTSFGSVATMGLAMVGIASTTSIPIPLVVGAIVSGAWLGDKMSPLSDTTNLASGVSKVGLYDHIHSMMYTTLPAGIVALILFTIAGLHYGGNMDTAQQQLIMNTLADNFHISLILILPCILVILISVFRLPSLLGMGLAVVISTIFGLVFQGVGFVQLMDYAFNGFSIKTGVAIVDPMLNRGGVLSMSELLVTFMIASVMGAIITTSGILDVLAKNVLLKFIKNKSILVLVTLIYCYIVNFLTAGGQTVAIIVTEQTFETTYKDMNISRRVLSRTLEDAGTLSAPIVPWGVATIYVMGVLGCSNAYIPYAWFIFIVPIFSMVCAITGIGMWDADEKPLRTKKA